MACCSVGCARWGSLSCRNGPQESGDQHGMCKLYSLGDNSDVCHRARGQSAVERTIAASWAL